MTKPLIVLVPHELGKAAARRRLDDALERVRATLGDKLTAVDGRWTGDRLDLQLRALGQGITAALDVADDRVRVEVRLPWMLAILAEKAKSLIRREGTLLLDKKQDVDKKQDARR